MPLTLQSDLGLDFGSSSLMDDIMKSLTLSTMGDNDEATTTTSTSLFSSDRTEIERNGGGHGDECDASEFSTSYFRNGNDGDDGDGMPKVSAFDRLGLGLGSGGLAFDSDSQDRTDVEEEEGEGEEEGRSIRDSLASSSEGGGAMGGASEEESGRDEEGGGGGVSAGMAGRRKPELRIVST
jgi:hypothetical protein